MTDSTITSIEGFHVGDHVRLRDDADQRANGRINGVRFGDGVIDRLDGSWSTGESIRVRNGVHDAGPRAGDWYWYAPDELELVHVAPPEIAQDPEPDSQPEPASDVPHGLAGLRKLASDIYGISSLWCAIRSESDNEWGVTKDDHGSLSETLARLADEIEAEQAADRGARLLPEGCSWPTYEDGTPVRIGDEVYDQPRGFTTEVARVAIRDDQWYLLDSDGCDISWGGRGDHPRRYVAPTPDLKPEDTWDQLREDATLPPASYCDRHDVNLDDGWEPSDAVQAMALDLIDLIDRLAKGGE